jgi:hypothetical protein
MRYLFINTANLISPKNIESATLSCKVFMPKNQEAFQCGLLEKLEALNKGSKARLIVQWGKRIEKINILLA